MTDYSRLLDYHVWANERIMTTLQAVPAEIFLKEFGGSFPSIRLTLHHLLSSDHIWINRWKGIPYIEPPADWNTANLSDLTAAWRLVLSQLKEASAAWNDRSSERLQFITKKGDPYEMRFSDTIVHMTHHGSYHRGQITNMLRIAREKTVPTDYFLFCAEGH